MNRVVVVSRLVAAALMTVVATWPAEAAHPVSPVYLVGGGRYCRDYRASIVVAGVVRIGSCTACLHRDGMWRVID